MKDTKITQAETVDVQVVQSGRRQKESEGIHESVIARVKVNGVIVARITGSRNEAQVTDPQVTGTSIHLPSMAVAIRA